LPTVGPPTAKGDAATGPDEQRDGELRMLARQSDHLAERVRIALVS